MTDVKFNFSHAFWSSQPATWTFGAGLEQVVPLAAGGGSGDHAEHGAVLGGARVAGPPRGHVVDDGHTAAASAAARRGAHPLRREEQFRPVVVVVGSEAAAAEEEDDGWVRGDGAWAGGP